LLLATIELTNPSSEFSGLVLHFCHQLLETLCSEWHLRAFERTESPAATKAQTAERKKTLQCQVKRLSRAFGYLATPDQAQ